MSLVSRRELAGSVLQSLPHVPAKVHTHPLEYLPAGMVLNNIVLIFSFPEVEHHIYSIKKNKSSISFVFRHWISQINIYIYIYIHTYIYSRK